MFWCQKCKTLNLVAKPYFWIKFGWCGACRSVYGGEKERKPAKPGKTRW